VDLLDLEEELEEREEGEEDQAPRKQVMIRKPMFPGEAGKEM
jgi:hypothetical protein